MIWLINLLFSISCLAQIRDVDKQYYSDYNLIKNPGFENGIIYWSKTGAGATWAINTSSPLFGTGDGAFNGSANNDAVTSSQVTVPTGLVSGGLCTYGMVYTGGDANQSMQIINGASTILSTTTLQASSTAKKLYNTFPCPLTGTVAFRILSSANSAAINIDQVFVGMKSGSGLPYPGLYLDVTMLCTSDIALSTTAEVATYGSIDDADLSITVNNPSYTTDLTAYVACTNTIASSGTTCGGSSENVGITFLVPPGLEGPWEVCIDFTHFIDLESGAYQHNGFTLVETSDTAPETALQNSSVKVASSIQPITTARIAEFRKPINICGKFMFSTYGRKAVRLHYEQTNSGTVNSNNIICSQPASTGQTDIHWSAKPVR